jgi:hypothetical protein
MVCWRVRQKLKEDLDRSEGFHKGTQSAEAGSGFTRKGS